MYLVYDFKDYCKVLSKYKIVYRKSKCYALGSESLDKGWPDYPVFFQTLVHKSFIEKKMWYVQKIKKNEIGFSLI